MGCLVWGVPGLGGAWSGGVPGPGGAWSGGIYSWRGAWSRGDICSRGGAWSWGVPCLGVPSGETPGRPLLRAVRILLQCILVLQKFSRHNRCIIEPIINCELKGTYFRLFRKYSSTRLACFQFPDTHFKLCSDRAKGFAKVKNFFDDVCHLLFDLLNLFFYLFRFRLVWIGLSCRTLHFLVHDKKYYFMRNLIPWNDSCDLNILARFN